MRGDRYRRDPRAAHNKQGNLDRDQVGDADGSTRATAGSGVIRSSAMPSVSEADNKALIRRWFEEVWNQGRERLVEQLRSPNTVSTGLGEAGGERRGNESFRAFYSNMRRAFPDLRIRIEDIIAEGDKVAVRITAEGTHREDGFGASATGRRITFGGIIMVRVANGQIAESWNNLDQLGLLQQIGALPESGPDRFLR